jgi:GNAT superfamily N-acetyltransferase
MSTSDNASTLQRWGLRKAIWSKLMGWAKPWFFLCRVNALEIEAYPEVAPPGGQLTIRLATREDLLAAAEEYPDQLSASFVEEAMSRGDYCVAAFDQAQMVAWAWASFDLAPHGDGLWVKVEPPYSYGYKWYTKPEYRGRGIILQLTVLRDKIGREAGRTHNIGFVETHNYASWRSTRRLGSHMVGYAGYFKLFGKPYPFRTPGVVKHSFRFVRR